MGLLKAAMGSVSGVMSDQWKEFFYCEAIDVNVLAVKGRKREEKRSSNTGGTDNIISSGSIVAVADGQAMVIVDQGKIVEFCAEPGEYKYDASSEASIFNGKLLESIKQTFVNIGKRFTFGGQPGKDQRIYYFNLKEIMGNKYGTTSPVPFRVVDTNIGLDVDIRIRCNGVFSYKLIDPMLFYANVCGNVESEYRREKMDDTLRTELLTALQPAFARIGQTGVRYSALPGHTAELAAFLNEELSKQWAELRGITIASLGVNSVTALPEDEEMIKELQRVAVMRNAGMAGATLVTAQADAMKAAASNQGGALMGFLGLNAAMNAGSNAGGFYNMDAQQRDQAQQLAAQQQAQQVAAGTWKCECGVDASGKFCNECGKSKPASDNWVCVCGVETKGKFCNECGKSRPVSNDWTCECGVANSGGKFCNDCGKQKP